VSEGRTTPGGPVTALSPNIGSPITLFLTDPNGGIYKTSGDPQKNWDPWSYVPGITAAPGSPVTAVGQLGSFALFITDINGGIWTTVGDAENGWKPWSQVPGITAQPRSPVTALGSALFITNINGEVYTTAGAGPQGWTWVEQGIAAPGSPVTAVPNQRFTITLFVVRKDGAIASTTATNWEG
jgi:hypothetical protein